MPRNNRQSINLLSNSQGFSLVELMVALVITLILLSGIGQIFLSSKKSFTIQDSLARQQENGRYALDSVAQDLRRAGYWGGNSDVSRIEGTLGLTDNGVDRGTCSNDTNWGRMLETRIFGLNDEKTGYACIPGTGADFAYERGDVLVVRYAAPYSIGGTTTPDYEANRLYIRSDLFYGRIFQGKDEDKTENEIPSPERIVAFDDDGACPDGTPYTPPGEADPTGCLLNVNLSTIRSSELKSNAYYIGKSGRQCAGEDVPSLFRIALDEQGQPGIEEIAYGVDQFQVRYGIDTDINPADEDMLFGDGTVDEYRNADEINLDADYDDGVPPASPHWGQVIAARIWILVRAECEETGYNNTNSYPIGDLVNAAAYTPADSYRRQLYQTTVKLRNR